MKSVVTLLGNAIRFRSVMESEDEHLVLPKSVFACLLLLHP